MRKYKSIKKLVVIATALATGYVAQSQSAGMPNSIWYGGECEQYRWPDVPSRCPEVIIKQKGDHHELPGDHTTTVRYRREGWDTVVTCEQRQIVLSCTPNIPARRFNGTYYVDEIPYDPADPTFALGTRMPITTDDNFSNYSTTIPYPFYFFGIQKSSFVLGANGLVAFGPVPVTNTTSTGPSCPWSYSAGIPWTDGLSGAPGSLSYMRDAIYGVYEDTYPSTSAHTTGAANWGIYYSVRDEYPCRKIICSWNDVPQYSCNSLHCTYQIVCYEGSNIIEVHVKERNVCSSWNGGNGIIGIQNATGVNQVANSNPSASNGWSQINGKPAAFYPSGLNPFTSNMSYRAFRFTPWGQTAVTYGWYKERNVVDTVWTAYRLDTTWTAYRLDTTWTSTTDYTIDTVWTEYTLDTVWTNYQLERRTVNDTLRNAEDFPAAINDPNGYYLPMHEQNDDYPCKFLTKAYVSPKTPTKYVFFLRFRDANMNPYDLKDSIMVGVDTLDYLNLHKVTVTDRQPKKLDVCIEDIARMRVDMNKLQEIKHEVWSVSRISNGNKILLDTLVGEGDPQLRNNYLTVDNYQMTELFRVTGNDTLVLDTTLYEKRDYTKVGDTAKTRLLTIQTSQLPTTGLRANKIDTLIIEITADYASGCHSFDTMMLRVFPKFDSTTVAGICRGETYTWDTNGHVYNTYTNSTDPRTTFVTLHSQLGCDSVVRLDLTVMDVSKTVIPVDDCKPYTWINGQTYTNSNTATMATDTVVLKNRWDCDSILQLQFTLHPLTAKLQSDVEYFTIDNLNAVLTDISIGGDSRVWKFPNGSDQTGSTAYYTIPSEMDGANIILIESSQYGCVDTAKIYIPLNKEAFWIPNAFTPDNPTGNNLFSSVSTKTLRQEMKIYNRRGEMVFECTGVDCAWDGRDLRGEPCVQGAYVYVIRYTNEYEPKQTKVLTGTVTLIR